MAKKLTKRKGFNFLRSYFDVLNEIPEDKDKLDFLLSVINKQFLDQDPKEDISFIVNLCYESQRHAIETSVKGYKDKTKTDLLGNPLVHPIKDPTQGGVQGGLIDPKQAPSLQEEEKGQVKEKEKIKEKNKLVENEFLNCSDIFFNRKAELKKCQVGKIISYAQNFWLNNYEGSEDLLSYNDVKRHFGNWIDKQDIPEYVRFSRPHDDRHT